MPRETVRIFIISDSFHWSTRCSSSQHLHHACLKSIPFLYFSRDHLRVDNGDHLRSILGIICGTVQLYTCSTHERVSLSHAPFFPTPITSKRLLRRIPTCSRGSSRNARLEIELKLNIILPANFLPFTS